MHNTYLSIEVVEVVLLIMEKSWLLLHQSSTINVPAALQQFWLALLQKIELRKWHCNPFNCLKPLAAWHFCGFRRKLE